MFKTKIPSPAILTIALAALVGCQSATESDSGANANLTLVTLSVPNMTWAGCAASVRGDLSKIEGVTDIRTDIAGRTCSFRLRDPDVDYRSRIEQFAESNPRLADYSIQ